jgi:hypothetical protein
MIPRSLGRAIAFVALIAVVSLSTTGCGPQDPKERILQERARWNVTVLNWSQGEDGTVTISTRLSGPPNSTLGELTVRLQLFDADSQVIESVWHTFDLSDVQRGGPADKIVRVREFPHEVFGAAVDPVFTPTADEEARISELQS